MILVGYGVDMDSVAGWLDASSGPPSAGDVSRGVFGAEVGTPRLLELLRRFGISTTWFIPGHTIDSFPRAVEAVVAAGHEIGHHGYAHEDPARMSRTQEEEVFGRAREAIRRVSGAYPRGYVAPHWSFSPHTVDILVANGIEYDHSMHADDFTPYYLTRGDAYQPIDYAAQASDWMVPYRKGERTDVIELPANWHLGDGMPMMYIPKLPNSHGWVMPWEVERLWREQFDWVYRNFDDAIFLVTIHPEVSGRAPALAMHERFISYVSSHANVRWVQAHEMADWYRRTAPAA